MLKNTSLDLYLDVPDPRVHVKVDDGPDNMVEVQISSPDMSATDDRWTVYLWFRDPRAVIGLGAELTQLGTQFQNQNTNKVADEDADAGPGAE
jgi:hypothetical protein